MEKIKYFLYARKSSEAEDRQVASIESQINELQKLAKEQSLVVSKIFRESKSAKAPGRLIFGEMISEINRGKARGIICWKLDRLARNPVDGGTISWMIQQGTVQHIQTYGKSYYPNDNVLPMQVELGMANQFVRELSVNVKRGLKTKVDSGWFPSVAPAGYLNTPDLDKGFKIIEKDPLRFPIVRKIWDLMLTGNSTPPQILKQANKEWGYRSPKRRSGGGKPLSRSGIYRILTNPFYYGWFEYPSGSGKWYKGKHKPMISKDEFDRAQILLGRKGKPSPHTRTFAYTGLIFCADCKCQITAEEKNQMICSECKFKFGYENKFACPKCQTPIDKMKNPKILNYVYYHGTGRKDPNCKNCRQYIKVEDLEDQIDGYLASVQIKQEYLDWAIKHLEKAHELESTKRDATYLAQERNYHNACKRLDRLLQLRMDEEITEIEYAEEKPKTVKDKEHWWELMQDSKQRQDNWLELSEKTFNFACYARYWFTKGDLQSKREILSTLGSNLTLKDKKLCISAPEPFEILKNARTEAPELFEMLEPKNNRIKPNQNALSGAGSTNLLRGQDSNLEPSR